MPSARVSIEDGLLSHQGDEYEKIIDSRSPCNEETTVYASCHEKYCDATQNDTN
jgi:hypothetical protein